jgi:hypothetical protein
MMNFMNEGGYAMWLMLVSALTVVGVGATRAAEKRAGVFRAGVILLLIEGMLGMATGMKAVAHFASQPTFAQLPNQAALVAEGLGELSNNGIFGAALALLLGVLALVAPRLQRPS